MCCMVAVSAWYKLVMDWAAHGERGERGKEEGQGGGHGADADGLGNMGRGREAAPGAGSTL